MASDQPQDEGVSIVDIYNGLLRPVQATLDHGIASTSDGVKLLVQTIRTPDTTLTLHLTEPQAEAWLAAWVNAVAKLKAEGSGLIVARGNLPPIPPNGGRPPHSMPPPSSRGGH